MGTGRAVGVVSGWGLVVVLSGCALLAPSDGLPEPHPVPTRSGTCVDLPLIGPDGGIVLGFDWSGEPHRYGETVVVHACAEPSGRARLTVVAEGTGISVRPRTAAVPESTHGVVPFGVTVRRGGSGVLRVDLGGSGVVGSAHGPVVVAGEDDWHFGWYDG